MVPIYDAANSTDAHLMKNLLEQAGIASYIRGEYLQGGLGDLPVNGMMQVCVDASDAERARSIVDDWNAATLEDVGDNEEIELSAKPTVVAPPTRTGNARIFWATILGAAVGSGLTWAAVRGPVAQYNYDYSGDGRPESTATYAGGKLERVESDRNRDGKADEVTEYDRDGQAVRGERDDDFDGRMETTQRYLHAEWLGDEIDRNGDGAIDYQSDAVMGVIYRERWFDANGKLVKRVLYKNGFPESGEIDSDDDGILDKRHIYGRTGEIIETQKL